MAQAGAIGAVMAARRRRPITDRTHVSAERLSAMDKEMREAQALTRIFRKYDTNLSHKLEPDQVKLMLTDLDSSTPPGTPPSDEELQYILKLCDDKCTNGAIDRSELKTAVISWKVYVKQRDQMTAAIEEFDKSGTGKLERPELKAYLTSLNGGIDVTDEEVEWVLSQADVFGDGACNKPELAKATAAWYSHVKEQQQKSSCCVII